MTSQSEEEGVGVHPLVSNLLGQKFVPRAAGEVFRYDRDEMMRLRKVPLSVNRPDYLSTDFNGEDGMFSPFKWLEHRWEVEGIKNRAPSKKLQFKDALRADLDDKAGLSPQRRGFSNGCRAPSSADDKKEREGNTKDEGWSTVERDRERDRLGSSGSSKWRNGASGGGTTSGDKYGGKSNDFKLPFQKSAGQPERTARSGAWKTVEGKERQSGAFSNNGKFIPARNYRGDDRGERLPEWADGPTTMDDMIELRGFEEPNKKKEKKPTKDKKDDKRTDKSDKREKSSRPSSRDNTTTSGECKPEAVPTALPSTDAELAAILGLLDVSGEVPQVFEKSEESPAPSGSRLSRFFNKNAQPQPSQQSSAPSHAEESSNPMLSRIFAKTPSTGGQTPSSKSTTYPQTNEQQQTSSRAAFSAVPMRLEDIERGIDHRAEANNPAEHTMRGNPLQDPNQQAQLMDKLHRMARQQGGQDDVSAGGRGSPPVSGGHPMNAFPGGMVPGAGAVLPPAFAHLADPVMHAHAQQAFNMQMQQAMSAAVANAGGRMLSSRDVEHLRSIVLRNVMAQHQAAAAMAAIQAQQHAHSLHQHAQQQQQQQQHTKIGNRPPATTHMIPASVQRHMNKTTSSQSEERRAMEKERDAQNQQDGEANRNHQAEVIKKMHMQQQYNALMSAMQTGLPMAAWRGPHPPAQQQQQQSQRPLSPPTNPNPQQMQALIAAAQAAHIQQAAQIRQKQAMMKMMQMQAQQQQQQQHGVQSASSMENEGFGQQSQQRHHQFPNGGGQQGQGHHPSSNGGPSSELSQVGPIQTPLEKLLAAAGVHAAQFTGGDRQQHHNHQHIMHRNRHPEAQIHDGGAAGHGGPPSSMRPMSLEEVERQLMEKSK